MGRIMAFKFSYVSMNVAWQNQESQLHVAGFRWRSMKSITLLVEYVYAILLQPGYHPVETWQQVQVIRSEKQYRTVIYMYNGLLRVCNYPHGIKPSWFFLNILKYLLVSNYGLQFTMRLQQYMYSTSWWIFTYLKIINFQSNSIFLLSVINVIPNVC